MSLFGSGYVYGGWSHGQDWQDDNRHAVLIGGDVADIPIFIAEMAAFTTRVDITSYD